MIRIAENLEKRKQLEIQYETERYNRLVMEVEKELMAVDMADETQLEHQKTLYAELEALKMEHEEILAEIDEEAKEAQKERDKEVYDNFAFWMSQAQQLISGMYDFRIAEIDNELTAIEKQKNREIKIAEERGEDTTAIEEKYAAKERELKKKQWIAKKSSDLTSAIISTALGVTQALGGSPPPASFIMAALVGLMGGIQIAKIASQQMPEFKYGGEMPYTGFAKTTEEGPEIAIMPSGNIKYLDVS